MKGLQAACVGFLSLWVSLAYAQGWNEDPLDEAAFSRLQSDEGPDAGSDGHAVDEPVSPVHSRFALGMGQGSSFSAAPLRKQVDETLWMLHFSLGLPFRSLEEGTFGAAFDFEMSYPTSIRTASGQNTHRFRVDPLVTYAFDVLFLDDVSLVLQGGLGFGLERVQFPRSTVLSYGALAKAGWSAYLDNVELPQGLSPFACMSFRYRPPLAKYKTFDSLREEDIGASGGSNQTAFSQGGQFTFASTGFNLGVATPAENGGTRLQAFVGFAHEWLHFKNLRREVSQGGKSSSANVGATSVRLGVERGF